jgi:hypothetical protein
MKATPVTFKRSRWNGFLGDVKRESCAFKEVLMNASAEKEESNRRFKESAQYSFRAIRYAARKNPDPTKAVPRLTRPQTRSAGGPPEKKSPWEFDENEKCHTWPARPITRISQRVLSPVRLQDYPPNSRPQDIICLYGLPVDRHDKVLSIM